MLIALPRTKGLDGSVIWFDDHRPEMARAALERATGLETLTALAGLQGALANFGLCENWHCYWCRKDRRGDLPVTTKGKNQP